MGEWVPGNRAFLFTFTLGLVCFLDWLFVWMVRCYHKYIFREKAIKSQMVLLLCNILFSSTMVSVLLFKEKLLQSLVRIVNRLGTFVL
jgi:hypothetical protein